MANYNARAKIPTYWNQLRINNNMTMKDIAEYLKVSTSTASKYITGKIQMSGSIINKLSELFDVDENEAIKETKRLSTLYFAGDGRSRTSLKPIEERTTPVVEETLSAEDESVHDKLREIFFKVREFGSNPVPQGTFYRSNICYLKASRLYVTNYLEVHPSNIGIGDSECVKQAKTVLKYIDCQLERYQHSIPLTQVEDTIEVPDDSANVELEPVVEKHKLAVESISKDATIEKVLDIIYGKVTRAEYNIISAILEANLD